MALSLCLSLILVVVTLDQATKIFFMGEDFTIIKNFILIEPRLNDGAAFSSFSGQRVLFIVFTTLALALMFYVLIKKKFSTHVLFRIAISVMIGGAIGNLIDRVAIGAVRDFIYLPPFNFVCNIADVAITVACVLFIVYLFFIRDKEETQKKLKLKADEKNQESKN